MKTIAVSPETYKELVRLKEELEARNMDDALKRLLVQYKLLLKKISIKKLMQLNKNEKKSSAEELLEDRKRYGWPRSIF